MPSPMSSRERLLAALRREEVDHAPCCVAFNPLCPARRKRVWNFPWPLDASLEERLAYQVGKLGLDQIVSVGVSMCRPAPGIESKVELDGDILHKTYATPAGELHAAVRYNEDWPHGQDIPFYSDFNIGHFVEPWIQSEPDLECLKQVHRPREVEDALDITRPGFESAKALADRFGLATRGNVMHGLTGALHLFGATDLCMMTIENPDLVAAYIEFGHEINLRTIQALGELGVDMVGRNGFYETADFYSADTLERFLGPSLRREADAAHAARMPISYTVNTGVMPILDHLAGLNMDSLFGIDIEFKGMDLVKLRDKLAPSKSLWLGPSNPFHLAQGPERTREAVRRIFDVFDKRGLILSPGVSVHGNTPWESALAMIDEWKKLR